MNGILADIIAAKRESVAAKKRAVPLEALRERAGSMPGPRDFIGALRGKRCRLIAEIKTASPSKGIIREQFDPAEIARIYETNGAACISVLTEESRFRGSLERLPAVRDAVHLPVLRKDFMIDPWQIYESRVSGADAILLIAACLDDRELAEFMDCAGKLGMACLAEVHDEREMERVRALHAPLIGINNRDLATFVTDLAATERLAPLAPDGAVLVSESGIRCADDVERVRRAGAQAVLVGEALMREPDIGAKVRELAGMTELGTED